MAIPGGHVEIAIFPPSDSWEKTTETMVKHL